MKFLIAWLLALLRVVLVAAQGCPYGHGAPVEARAEQVESSTEFLSEHQVDDSKGFMTSDVGGQIDDQGSLRAGIRGPTLLEDFRLRQKIQHFDHERVPERAVHARGAGAKGTFTSYGDWSNITAASFLSKAGKQTDVYVRFSTVAGSRGSVDTARDLRGFATRFYTDEGNFDIVGNNVPVFFIQDAIQFPDLIHSVKPQPDNEIPQAGSAHDTAWDFFSQQSSTMHALFWAMSGNGLPRSYRHMDGFGVHTFRFVTDEGISRLIKWHFKTLQGKASLLWEEAQVLAGKNSDFHRQDLWDSIVAGNGPEWELAVQVVDEDKAMSFGFDLLDPTKFLPEELAPLIKLGKMKLDTNPKNYFAETEQIMFQPGHIVRGIDFTEDPLLQGRLFSYLDTQLNRHGGPNFEQLPINRPKAEVHNNNRDGAGQMYIHKNNYAYTPNTLNSGNPAQANQTNGRGFFTAPSRAVNGRLTKELADSFNDHWSQAALFYNSLTTVEQQFVVNAMRFEISKVQSTAVRQAAIKQINRVNNDIANRVAAALGITAPVPDSAHYSNASTQGEVGTIGKPLPTVKGLRVVILAATGGPGSIAQAKSLKDSFSQIGVSGTIVAENLLPGTSSIDATYSATDASTFDGVIVAAGAENLVAGNTTSSLYPAGRPLQILVDAFHWGKPVGAVGSAQAVYAPAKIPADGPGVVSASDVQSFVQKFEAGLRIFKFVDRFPLDNSTRS